MDIKAEEISKITREQIGSYAVDVDVAEVGSVISLGDGIARVHGVDNAMAGEMLEFPHGVFGIALNLEEDSVGTVLLGDFTAIKEGVQDGATEMMVDTGAGGLLPVLIPPPQPMSAKNSRGMPKACGNGCLKSPRICWRREPPMWILILHRAASAPATRRR